MWQVLGEFAINRKKETKMSNMFNALCAISTVASVFIGLGALLLGIVGGYF